MNRKAVIFGIRSTKLSPGEKFLLKKNKPWGIILFSRNIKSLYQLKDLIYDIKNTIRDNKYPILIDQEGGKVSRLNKIIDFSCFSQKYFGKLYQNDKKLFFKSYEVYIYTVCDVLKSVGININIAPVLDVERSFSHDVLGSRIFSKNSDIVSKLGNYCINLYKNKSIGTVIKHIPGQGLSKSDTHDNSSIINAKKKSLIRDDFKPFKACQSLFAMTSHTIYKSYDPFYAATHSKIVIHDVIRQHIGFKGILISDDISMKSLKYGLVKNATKALAAGCNLILHCNGNMKEMNKLAKIIPTIDEFTQKKTSHFYKFLG